MPHNGMLDRNGYVVSSCVDDHDARVAMAIMPPSPASLEARICRSFVVCEV